MIELSLELETAFMSKPQTDPPPVPCASSSTEGTPEAPGPNPQITALTVQTQNFLKVWGSLSAQVFHDNLRMGPAGDIDIVDNHV